MIKAIPLTGTFLDEISHDIPHQNWGPIEWERDFQAMQAIGIDTVVLIRSGHKRWLTYPSEVLISKAACRT
jgi:kynurenine formamidase